MADGIIGSPVAVTSGQTVWLSWVFENNPGISFTAGTPGRANSTDTWSAGMPGTFGTSTFDNYTYSVYCKYTSNTTILKDGEITGIEQNGYALSLSAENFTNSLGVKDFNLYPNPAKSFINVDYSILPEIETKIIIIDGTGRIILNRLVDSSSNRIDISQFSTGVYYVRAVNRQWNITKKLVVN